MDYKDSLLLPKTDFPMRGNLPQNEPKRYKTWQEKDIYNKMKNLRATSKESFTLHDGPPYANGNIHIGHALNKILKDIIVKQNYFSGKKISFTPGWDCHGLPIEQQVEKKIGKTKKDNLEISKFRELCRQHAKKYVTIQKDEFKELGIIADWDNPYLTMDFRFEANIYRELCDVAKQGLLVQRSKPIYWSWGAKTALAEAEVEYEDKISPSIYVAFKLQDEALNIINEKQASIIIWTTTPWTLPANVAISLNPEEEYVLTTDNYIVAKALYENLKQNNILKGEIKKDINPKDLELKKATNPLNSRDSVIVLGEHVTMDSGTGAVHTAPGHGEDDYNIGLKYNLEVIMPVDEEGKYDYTIKRLSLIPDADDFMGLNVFKANDKILELLGDSLLKKEDITHSYPHCWRTHTPIIFRATKQWFIAVDKEYGKNHKTLRELSLNEIKDIKFYPVSGENRLNSMIENRPDWCISRQRSWGVPIAFFRDKKSDKIIYDEKVLNFIAMIFEQKGADAWYDLTIEELLYPGSGLNPDDLEKTDDILDVWFDSGSTQRAVLRSRNYDTKEYPADLYLEGSDQHRGWFQSSLLVSTATKEQAPFKQILTHGFTVDEHGNKMSKSKGNVVAPKDVIKEFGSEILRLWVATSDYQGDLKISKNILKQIAEQYRKLRNTFRFLLANINDLEALVDIDKLGVLDRWILSSAKTSFDEIKKDFDEFNFVKGFSTLNNFIVSKLSGVYLDLSKDRLYCDSKNDIHRRASQSAMAYITKALIGLIAPVLTYTADEIIEYAPKFITNNANDIFEFEYFSLPELKSTLDEEYFLRSRELFFESIDELKKSKQIKSTLELVIYTNSKKILDLDPTEAEDWFIVSKVIKHNEEDILASFELDGDRFEVYRGIKSKCPRCWKHKAKDEDSLCQRCADVV